MNPQLLLRLLRLAQSASTVMSNYKKLEKLLDRVSSKVAAEDRHDKTVLTQPSDLKTMFIAHVIAIELFQYVKAFNSGVPTTEWLNYLEDHLFYIVKRVIARRQSDTTISILSDIHEEIIKDKHIQELPHIVEITNKILEDGMFIDTKEMLADSAALLGSNDYFSLLRSAFTFGTDDESSQFITTAANFITDLVEKACAIDPLDRNTMEVRQIAESLTLWGRMSAEIKFYAHSYENVDVELAPVPPFRSTAVPAEPKEPKPTIIYPYAQSRKLEENAEVLGKLADLIAAQVALKEVKLK